MLSLEAIVQEIESFAETEKNSRGKIGVKTFFGVSAFTVTFFICFFSVLLTISAMKSLDSAAVFSDFPTVKSFSLVFVSSECEVPS